MDGIRRAVEDNPELLDQHPHIFSADIAYPAAEQDLIRDQPGQLDRHAIGSSFCRCSH
jgi:hypothetical protein